MREFSQLIQYDLGITVSATRGSAAHETILSSVPPGRYRLRIAHQSPVVTAYTLQVYRDVPQWSNFYWFAGLVLFIPVILYAVYYAYELKRWRNSDHPWMY